MTLEKTAGEVGESVAKFDISSVSARDIPLYMGHGHLIDLKGFTNRRAAERLIAKFDSHAQANDYSAEVVESNGGYKIQWRPFKNA